MSFSAIANPISFQDGWKEQRFSLFRKNRYSFSENSLGIVSNKSVSITYAALPERLWDSTTGTWAWSVETTVPATDLSRKGGDDRNISLYVVFLPKADAEDLQGKKVTRLLRNKNVRVLVYVWGGNHERGTVLASPYLADRGKTIVLRDAGTGTFRENVDLRADFQRAFGYAPGAVVGLAVSADSDDTKSSIQAVMTNLELK